MKDAAIKSERLHADPVAKDCTARKRTRRIDGNNSDALALAAIMQRQFIYQRRLPGTRRNP